MNYKKPLIRPEQIEQAILLICGHRVMLDRDLAALYGVTTGNLNKAFQRNSDRFPADFMFQPTDDEATDLIFQLGRSRRHGGRQPSINNQSSTAQKYPPANGLNASRNGWRTVGF
jgi:hypothetical protein